VPLPADLGAEIATVAIWQGDVQDDRVEPRFRRSKMTVGFIQRGRLGRMEQTTGSDVLRQDLAQRVVATLK
jgi:hypothetical protein